MQLHRGEEARLNSLDGHPEDCRDQREVVCCPLPGQHLLQRRFVLGLYQLPEGPLLQGRQHPNHLVQVYARS